MKMKSINQKQSENMGRFLRDGPRLSMGYQTWIISRSAGGRFMELGGLGAMGCGEMWVAATDEDRKNPEWEKAKIVQFKEGDQPFGIHRPVGPSD